MGVVQWLLLVLAIGGVITIYVVTKRREGPNPWQDMQNPDVKGQERIPPGQETHFADQQAVQVTDKRAEPFEGVLGADDIPDIPSDLNDSVDEQDDLPGYEVRSEPDMDVDDASSDLNPAGLNRRSVPVEQQRIVVLHVGCKGGELFHGEEIHAALQKCRLQFGMRDVYHRITEENGVPEAVYSVANMLKPGYLNPDEAADLESPGLTMFMALPGPIDGVPACRDMMETANQLAEYLGGEVLDDQRALLKRQTAQFLLDEIAEDDRKRRIKAQHA